MRQLVVACRKRSAAGADEAQATVLDLEPAALEKDEPVPVGVGDASLVETEAAGEHGWLAPSGRAQQQHPEPERAMAADATGEECVEGRGIDDD